VSLIIGRTSFGCGPTGGSVVDSGQQRSFDITVDPGSLGAAVAMRQQLLGYTEPGQEVVPVQWVDDPIGWDGFWRVRNVRVTPVAAYLSNGVMRAQMTMERVGPSWASPTVAMVQSTSLRPNVEGVTVAAISADVFTPFTTWVGAAGALSPLTLISPGGATPSLGGGWFGANMGRIGRGAVAETFRFAWFPTSMRTWYDGGCWVEWRDSDGVWWPLVGTVLPRLGDIDDVRFGSALVRCWPTTAFLAFQRYDGAGGTADDFYGKVPVDFGIGGAKRDPRLSTPSVLVNSTNLVVAEYALNAGGYARVAFQRGHSHAEIELNYPLATSPNGAFVSVPGGTGTAITGGIKRSTNDADGQRWAILSAAGTKTTASPATISANSATGISNVGVYLGTDANVTVEGVARYFAGVSTSQRVVS